MLALLSVLQITVTQAPCPTGYWESVTTGAERPICVPSDTGNYDRTPMDLITSAYNSLSYSEFCSRLRQDTLSIEQLVKERAIALRQEPPSLNMPLFALWPASRHLQATSADLMALLCPNSAVNCHAGQNRFLSVGDWFRTVVWQNPLLIASQFVEQHLFENLSATPNRSVSLAALPSHWFQHRSVGQLIEVADAWQMSMAESGWLFPTAGQLGVTIYQAKLVAQAGTGGGLPHGQTELKLVVTNPSDQTKPQARQGRRMDIITGSNRFIKPACNLDGRGGPHHNQCGYVQVTLGAGGPEAQRYILVNGQHDKTTGGDKIIHNTPEGNPEGYGDLASKGDFTSPNELVGSTNDLPILPPGNGQTEGPALDQCFIKPPDLILPYRRRGGPLVPVYYNPEGMCPNLFRKPRHTKYLLMFGQQGPQYVHLVEAPRQCVRRQTYRPLRCLDAKKGELCGFEAMPITACYAVSSAQGQQKIIRTVGSQQTFPWLVRSNLKSMTQ